MILLVLASALRRAAPAPLGWRLTSSLSATRLTQNPVFRVKSHCFGAFTYNFESQRHNFYNMHKQALYQHHNNIDWLIFCASSLIYWKASVEQSLYIYNLMFCCWKVRSSKNSQIWTCVQSTSESSPSRFSQIWFETYCTNYICRNN